MAVSCGQCDALLSSQDLPQLLGPGATSRVYTALAAGVRQVSLSAQQQGQAGDEPTPAAAVAAVCVELWGELAALQALMLGGEPPSATAAATTPTRRQVQRGKGAQQKQQAKPASKSKAKKHHGSGSSSKAAWAAGTGYGGQGGLDKSAQAAMSAAARRQSAADTAMQAHLAAITALLQDPLPEQPGSHSGRKRGRGEGLLPSALPWPLVAVVLAGPLAWLLRLLFENDSLMDVVGRRGLYSAGMELLRLVGSSTDLLPLLQLPADDPRDASPPAHTSTAAGPSSSSTTVTTLLSTLRRLEQQAKMYRRSAEQLMAQDEEAADDQDTTAAVCLALDLSSIVQTLEEGVQLWGQTLGQAGALTIKPISATVDTQRPAPQPAAAAAAAPTGRQRSKDRAATSSQAAGATAAAAAAALYVSAMQPFRFIEADLLGAGHHYARDAAANSKQASGGEVMRRRLKRVTEELGSLSTSLPLAWDSSILLAVHADRLDVLRALLLPHPDTPYGGGAFCFDILLPPEYPDKPPKVKFLTTGGGSWRANPNLYDCGKVCLSLLGTWSGPSWEPGVSTLLQVLVSLQSMVFVPDPFYNEPGYERHASTASGKAQAADYNAGVRLGTATHAILAQLRHPDPVFGEAIKLHYRHQGARVTALLQQWVKEASGGRRAQLQQVVTKVEQELGKLPALPPVAPPPEQQQEGQDRGAAGRREGTSEGAGRTSRGGRQQQQTQAVADVDVVDLT